MTVCNEVAKVYYVTALEKYRQLADAVHEELIQTKISSIEGKLREEEEKEKTEEEYLEEVQALKIAK